MPKYFDFKVADCFLYFTSQCTVEAMHVHANKDGKLREQGSAKFWVGTDGKSKLANDNHNLSNKQIRDIQKFIQIHYKEMYESWSKMSTNGYYNNI